MKTTILPLKRPADGRLIALSDVHGQLDWLKGLMNSLAFSERDRLLIAGDLSERGEKSLETLRFIMDMTRKGRFAVTMGNVEAKQLELLDDPTDQADHRLARLSRFMKKIWGHSMFDDMAGEIGFDLDHEEKGVVRLFNQHFREEIAFIRSLPTMADEGDFLFVHGGVPTDDTSLLTDDAVSYLKNDDFLGHAASYRRYLAVGHWPVVNYRAGHADYTPVIDEEKRIISIDGGCGIKEHAQLNALILYPDSGDRFELAAWDPFERIRALDSQEEFDEGLHVRYGHNDVRILELGEETARVILTEDGRELTLPASFVRVEEDRTFLHEYTTYRPRIHPGDGMRLLKTLPCGAMVKKDGRVGWYLGRFEKADES